MVRRDPYAPGQKRLVCAECGHREIGTAASACPECGTDMRSVGPENW